MKTSAAALMRPLVISYLAVGGLSGMIGCAKPASITFLKVPPASSGGANSSGLIQGRVVGRHRGQHILVYVFADSRWWVQPFVSASRTEIADDGVWKAKIHLGTIYAAILTKDNSTPQPFLDALPAVGKEIEAIGIVKGGDSDGLPPEDSNEPILRFSGLEWRVRTNPGNYASSKNEYSSRNVAVDASGALHLRLSRGAHGWICSEIHTIRSLGYGNYIAAVEDTSHLEPAVMFSEYNYFEQTADGDHRELAIHLTRRGVASNTNAEFSVQPVFEPANFYHFTVPPGPLTFDLNWHADEAALSVFRGDGPGRPRVASWLLRTRIPKSDDTHLYFNFCSYGYARTAPTRNAEVVVSSFHFYP